jgi:diguanylate cyclase (GGDEF)-like protein
MSLTDEMAAKLALAERRLEALTSEVARNDDKMRRSQQRELRLLQADDLGSLIGEMLLGLRASYGLEYVSVVLCDPDHDIRHLLLAAGTPVEGFENLVMVESMAGIAPQYVALRQPWLGAHSACDHQLVCPGASGLASVAMIPLVHRHHLTSFCIENEVNRARLLRSGFTDVLTGWHNRRYFQVRIKEELARSRREQCHLACLMLDIDHFKRVNDTWGHAAGDAVLQEFANRIDAEIRANDVAARYGGEEFVVLLPSTDIASATLLAERIHKAVSREPYELPGGDSVDITASIGIDGVCPDPKADDLKTIGDSLLARADVALYRAKSGGRDQIAVDEG